MRLLELVRRAPVLVRSSNLGDLLPLLLVPALACGQADVSPTPGSGIDASPVFGADPQSPSEGRANDATSGPEPLSANDNPSIVNVAVGDRFADGAGAKEPSSAADPGGSSDTEPGVDPGSDGGLAGIPAAILPDEAPEERPADAPRAYGDDFRELTRGNAQFAFELYGELSPSDGNLFFSPHSISAALAMTYAGARGSTETAMAETLRFSLPQERLHREFDALARDLAGRSTGDEKARFRLNAANAVWAQDGHSFRDAYLSALRDNYGGGVLPSDFVGDPEGSRSEINRWVSDETEDKIRDLTPPGLIDGLTRMVLVNAVYFNGGWLYPFDEHLTTRESFRLLDGGTTDVEMMRATEYFGYAAGDGYQTVDLPYVGDELSMAVLLPDQGRFEEFEGRLDASFVDQALDQVVERYVALELPRFEFDAAFRLGEALKAMGMSAAFDAGAADFSGMDGLSCATGDDGCLYVADVVHKAFVSVDEAGTEAAAATGVMMTTESAKPRPVAVRVDRPFIFLIRDRATGTVLFLGRVTEP